MSSAPAAPAADPLAVTTLYTPHKPEPPQAAFYKLDDLGILEALYGGAAGGGKSDAILAGALRYVDVPGYSALILRRSYQDLALPGAIMARSKEWLMGTDARWSQVDFRWTFPSSATLSFGYLRTYNDVYQYQGADFQYVGFDELTQFAEAEYRYLFSRLRGPSPDEHPDDPLAHVPLRMRSASNPGGRGHDWVLRRLIEQRVDPDDPHDTEARARRRIFIPAKLDDNPHVDRGSYVESLMQLDAHLRAQLLDGDWYSRPPGDWVYDSRHIDAAVELGIDLDEQLAAGRMPPPAGGTLDIGVDWGEFTHGLIGWPLERGGLYIAAEEELDGVEPSASATAILDRLEEIVELGRQTRPRDYAPDLTPAQAVASRRRVGPTYPPALPPRGDAVRLVGEHRYDAAGIQSMRTYAKVARRRHPAAKVVAVPFGAPAPRSGTAVSKRSFKAETIGYIRRGLERAYVDRRHGGDVAAYVETIAPPADSDRAWDKRRKALEVKRIGQAGPIAITGDRAATMTRQLRNLEWLDREAGTVRKGDDHGADALIALAAPLAIRHR